VPTATQPQANYYARLPLASLVTAALALTLSLAGLVISVIALGQSDNAATVASRAGHQPSIAATDSPPTDLPHGTNSATAGTADTSTIPETEASPGDINPSTQFVIAYEGENLRIRSFRCNSDEKNHVDLDEPRVIGKTADKSEISYEDCDPGRLSTELQFAQVSGSSATPADCLERIRTDPGRSPIAPSSGMTLCVVTSQNRAAAEGISQKLIFVTVDSIARDNDMGVLNVTVKAWKVPR
jgi:hypothetical protein